MAKYDEQFKLLVQRYLSGKGGYDALCKRDGVADSMLKRWVASDEVLPDKQVFFGSSYANLL